MPSLTFYVFCSSWFSSSLCPFIVHSSSLSKTNIMRNTEVTLILFRTSTLFSPLFSSFSFLLSFPLFLFPSARNSRPRLRLVPRVAWRMRARRRPDRVLEIEVKRIFAAKKGTKKSSEKKRASEKGLSTAIMHYDA